MSGKIFFTTVQIHQVYLKLKTGKPKVQNNSVKAKCNNRKENMNE